MVTPEDMMMASKLVTVSPGYLSKWTKAELTSAALALKLFVHELPGGPKLLHRAAELASSSSSSSSSTSGNDGMLRAVEAIRCQEGVDASLYRRSEGDAAATSTQRPDGMGVSWADITASQIPSAQGDGSSISSESNGGNGSSGNGSAGGVPGGEVSDHSSYSVRSLAAPTPRQLAKAGVVGDDGVVDEDANGTGVARAGGVGDESVGGDQDRNKQPPAVGPRSSLRTTTRVCNRVWKGKKCNREHKGCGFPHPTICRDDRCVAEIRRGCTDFHPPNRAKPSQVGNGSGGARQGNGASGRAKPARRNNGNNSTRHNSSSSNRPTYSQLRERLAAMKLQRSKEKGIRKELRKLRELTHTQGSPATNMSGTGGDEGCALAPQLHPEVLGAVVSAVMAVLGEKGLRQEGRGEQRRCRC